MNNQFTCDCNAPVRYESEDYAWHKCRRPSQSYGMSEIEVPYRRVEMAKRPGEFQWWVDWK